jgi:hypothetical protein
MTDQNLIDQILLLAGALALAPELAARTREIAFRDVQAFPDVEAAA